MYVPPHYLSESLEKNEIEINTMEILSVLSECGAKGTFFILGRIGRDMPVLVRKIADEGHEVACHGFFHKRLFNLSRSDTEKSLKQAKHYLEDASGVQVYGFRAPDFSIIQSNLWVHDILQQLSFKYDSSIYPIGFHDVYGIEHVETAPFKLKNGLIEIPLSTVKLVKNFPFGGGGYFRLYPLLLTKLFITITNRMGIPVVFYLHPFEIGKIVPRIHEISLLRKFRTYYGVGRSRQKLKKLLDSFSFVRIIDYVRSMWQETQ
jgi:polysaccharide deacetylase family protein (PEP-CTERM system associated)